MAAPMTSNRCAILAWGYEPRAPPPPSAFHTSSKAECVNSINSSTFRGDVVSEHVKTKDWTQVSVR